MYCCLMAFVLKRFGKCSDLWRLSYKDFESVLTYNVCPKRILKVYCIMAFVLKGF